VAKSEAQYVKMREEKLKATFRSENKEVRIRK
jgi:hypothetical protein